jgi:hypothetical protein
VHVPDDEDEAGGHVGGEVNCRGLERCYREGMDVLNFLLFRTAAVKLLLLQ